MKKFLVFLILALLLFVLTRIIGKRSLRFGYETITIYTNYTEAGFNLIYRLLTPAVYLIIISAILYHFHFNWVVKDIYLVVILFTLFRWAVIFIIERQYLIRWKIEIFISILVVLFNYFIYTIIIANEVMLTPDLTSLRDELWLLVILFVYKLLNNTNLSYQANKEKYLEVKVNDFYKKYHDTITSVTKNKYIWPIIYAIMIIENFNRPPLVRRLEYILFSLRLSETLGIMQVKTKKKIDDNESVRLGSLIIRDLYNKYPVNNDSNYYSVIDYICENYNPGNNYTNEIRKITEKIARILKIGIERFPEQLSQG